MSVTNHAIGEIINLASVLNSKLEAPILQSEMGLDSQAIGTKQAVRWDEFSVKHTNDGGFKNGAVGNEDISVGAITQDKMRTKAVVPLSDTSVTLTATQLITSGIFTVIPTAARTLTTDTAANIIAGLPGYQVGTYFEFTIITLGNYALTLSAGTGVTIVGSAVTTATAGSAMSFYGLITSSNTITIYRK